MACSQGVTPHLLKDLKLALDRTPIHSSAQRTEIMEHAHTLESELLFVQEESFMGVESQLPDSKSRFILINKLPLYSNMRYRLVESGCARPPKHRILYAELLFEPL